MAHHTQERRNTDNFFMDLENWALEHRWDARIGIPCGRARHLDHLWGEVMRGEMADYPRRTFDQYCEWVESGGGDDWFQPEEPDHAYIEAQAKQRTSYLCRDMVAPLSVSLHERIVPLALAQRQSNAQSNAQSNGTMAAVEVNGRGEPPTDLRRIGQAGG